jgi:hypothetical protein
MDVAFQEDKKKIKQNVGHANFAKFSMLKITTSLAKKKTTASSGGKGNRKQ